MYVRQVRESGVGEGLVDIRINVGDILEFLKLQYFRCQYAFDKGLLQGVESIFYSL